MRWNENKKCFVADDGKKLEMTFSVVNRYPLGCDKHAYDCSTMAGCKERAHKRYVKWQSYLVRELELI